MGSAHRLESRPPVSGLEHQAELSGLPTVSVIIPAFSMDRWDGLCRAVASVRAQRVEVLKTVVAIDHNPELMSKAIRELDGVKVVANTGSRGASGTRNAGVAASDSQVLAFLDDDAVAGPGWLETLLQHFSDPSVVGVGGRLEPMWKTDRPRWFPVEFDWAVGCSYRGMPESVARVRNVWSNNMAIRRQIFESIGGFRDSLGKVGDRSRPEDTDLCLRVAACNGAGVWIYEPSAIAGHQVPAERTTLKYFLRRCYLEGQGKAVLASLNGVNESTCAEREYARSVLPKGIVRGLGEMAHGEASGVVQSLVIIVGLSFAIIGFLASRARGYALCVIPNFRTSGA
jgi:cellulose synthase/poly-beta-1,6-N-acetylglucosamine synthase-like glycosyltransferase